MPRHRKDYVGTLFGLVVFLAGIGLLVFVFKNAYELFSVPPDTAIGINKKGPISIDEASRSGIALVWRIVLMMIMCVIASIIANRGIKLYSEAKNAEAKHAEATSREVAPAEKSQT